MFYVLINFNQFPRSQMTSSYIKSIRDQTFKDETPSSDFVTSVTHSITNMCFCVQYVLYPTYSNEICTMFSYTLLVM